MGDMIECSLNPGEITESTVAVSDECYQHCNQLSERIGAAAIMHLSNVSKSGIVTVTCEQFRRRGCNARVDDYKYNGRRNPFVTVKQDGSSADVVEVIETAVAIHGSEPLVDAYARAQK